ncbi:MAG: cation-translocating P-type ATPase [Pseudomonadota bacterium]|jgi:Ca2+-transporting ATPase
MNEPASAWASETAALLARLGTDTGGLTAAQARERLAQFGVNRLTERPPRPLWATFLDQFKSLLVLVLLAAAVIAGAIGDLKDMAVILAVVLANAALGLHQEHRAESSLAALRKMLARRARVRREGRKLEVPADELVPGDLVLLEAGDKVPADGRILAAHSLEVDESALTGESQPVGKHANALSGRDTPLAERLNMVFMNTVVTRGRAEMVVTATGMRTEMGRIAGMMAAAEEGPTPLQRQLDRLGKRLALIAGLVVALIFALALYQGEPLARAAMTAITLAVAAIPEGLPAVVTVTLALGMQRMARRRAIVKRLAAMETLGCTTVICSDKTGTLTLNQMTVRACFFRGRRFAVSGEGYRPVGEIKAEDGAALPELAPLLLPAALCNDSRIADGEAVGDPTEAALQALAAKGGIDPERTGEALPRVAEIPFDSAHKFMATFHLDGDSVRIFVKGAPDVLMARSARVLLGDEVPLDEAARSLVQRENERMAAQALRVLGVASRTLPAARFHAADDLFRYVENLCFVGLVGLMDPPRPEAKEAIALCRAAGIEVKMITGDQPATAQAIARELGLAGECMTGAELAALAHRDMAARIDSVAVFARVAPEHKVRIVQALKARGHVVAMTGDGVNDAPALKTADIGVAMGVTGTEVAKEAGAMILTDDNFATIVRAVREGRTIYDNIVKFVRFQLATNMGALASVLGAAAAGWSVPFNPIQILWVNIIMDGPPAMALGVDPARHGLMQDPPRSPSAEILTWRRLGKLAAIGVTMAVGTLGVLQYGLATGDETRATTLAFTTFVLFQFFNVFNARAERGSAFRQHFFGNRLLWLALAGVLGMQAAAVHWAPAQAVFRTSALSFLDWAVAFAVASTVLLLEEARKLLVAAFTRMAGRAATGR